MYHLPLALEFFDTLLLGRGTMIPLLGASVLLVAVVLERLIMLRRSAVLPPRLVKLIEGMAQAVVEAAGKGRLALGSSSKNS